MGNETYSSEGPQCPYCKRQYTADEPFYYDEMNFNEMECDGCGKTFNVSLDMSPNWVCETRDEDDEGD